MQERGKNLKGFFFPLYISAVNPHSFPALEKEYGKMEEALHLTLS